MDEAEATQILQENVHLIERVVKRTIRDTSIVEDIVQEAKIKIYKSLVKGSRPDNIESWISIISRHTAYDELRKVQRNDRNNDGFIEFHRHRSHSITTNPEDKIISKETVIQIQSAFSSLDETTQKILHLKYNGLSYKEIAKQLNCTVAVIKTKVFRGRKKLAQQLVSKQEVYDNELREM
ncbi:sigma-70 family RNA polymerase sigma factor [Bacillus sp. CGMCC 1.16541]|uniref:RNA polymerase sigma factor n=1 Tax=Bacillus sp. CGMCC 1.16541 TaxID=2185143 RepID=UPI0013A59766|nr:sigma-70 family RNA polymerase sigma factor [Bacillus sp. CGMCC 1.16541]